MCEFVELMDIIFKFYCLIQVLMFTQPESTVWFGKSLSHTQQTGTAPAARVPQGIVLLSFSGKAKYIFHWSEWDNNNIAAEKNRSTKHLANSSRNKAITVKHTYAHSASQLKSWTHIHTHKQHTRTYATTIKSMTAWHFLPLDSRRVRSKCRYLIVFITSEVGGSTTSFKLQQTYVYKNSSLDL